MRINGAGYDLLIGFNNPQVVPVDKFVDDVLKEVDEIRRNPYHLDHPINDLKKQMQQERRVSEKQQDRRMFDWGRQGWKD